MLLGVVGGASLLVKALVTLLYVPGVFAVTAMLTLQLELAERLPPVRPIAVAFSVAPLTTPPHVFATDGVECTRRPLGNASLNERPVSPVDRGLVMVIVNAEGAPAVIPVTEKLFAIVGNGWTVRVALAALPFPPGTMGPKVLAACRFATATGRAAHIGRLDQADAVLEGGAGTTVDGAATGIEFWER